jgi:pilus assembly protein Flp/PilA
MALIRWMRTLAAWVPARLGLERGATAVEYGLMLALIAAVIIVAVVFLGRQTSATFRCVGDSIADKTNSCPP